MNPLFRGLCPETTTLAILIISHYNRPIMGYKGTQIIGNVLAFLCVFAAIRV